MIRFLTYRSMNYCVPMTLTSLPSFAITGMAGDVKWWMIPNMSVVKRMSKTYFMQRGFRRMFKAARRKYESLGRIGGSIRLQKLTDDEKQALSGLLSRNVSR